MEIKVGTMMKFRHNIMNVSSIGTFENIKGVIHDDCKDVYFVRAVGTNSSYVNDVKKLDDTLMNQMNEGKSFYCRLSSLPRLSAVEDTDYYVGCYSRWIDSGKKNISIKSSQSNHILSGLLSEACLKIEELYKSVNKQVSESMMKNYIVKLLFWYDGLFDSKKSGNADYEWNERMSIKIVASNVEKVQEYLFYYMLTLTGCDVLLLQSSKDVSDDEELGLSTKFVLGAFSDIQLPEYVWRENRQVQVTTQNNSLPRVVIPPRPNSQPRNNVVTVENISQRNNVISREIATETTGEKSFEELALLASSIVMIAIHDDKGEVIGSGSGIMIGQSGYILTNNHVTAGGRYYSVRIEEDDNVYETDEMIKYNQFFDLAIIRIDRRLQPIKVYNGTKKLVRGQKVVAIGSPLGLFNSVSNGIISGFRKIDQVDMIQFTAPTSHGSSGGAVLNMQGEVIGISTAGFSSGQNINLAVGYECINQFIRGFT